MSFLFGNNKLNDSMYVIAGLGNKGKEYDNTRHNAGFMFIDELADRLNINVSSNKFDALCGQGFYNGKKVFLLKPQTYMNLSGNAVAQVCNYYKIPLNTNLMITYDDTALPLGNLRIRENGSAGGHNGMKSIINALRGDSFIRIRLGIGEKTTDDLADYVLGKMTSDENVRLKNAVKNAADAALMIIEKDVSAAMNEYNTKKKRVFE